MIEPGVSEDAKTLLDVLALDNVEGARTEEDIFVGRSQVQPHGRVFGGQVLAQSVLAAAATVEDRLVHSMHGYFIRPGDANKSITFAVQRLRDGRSFSARRTQAYQNGVPILSMIASFQSEDDGVEHFEAPPENIPDPESLPSAAQVLSQGDSAMAQAWLRSRPFDIRHVTSPIYLQPDEQTQPVNAVWMRAISPLPDDEVIHRAALAYASDFTLLEPTLRRHRLHWSRPGLSIASLDHAMWWFRPVRVDQWLLYVQRSVNASGARGLSQGRFYDRSGTLIAAVAQEGMIRVREKPMESDGD